MIYEIDYDILYSKTLILFKYWLKDSKYNKNWALSKLGTIHLWLFSPWKLQRPISVRIRSIVMYQSNHWVALKIRNISEHFRTTFTMNETNPSLITAGKWSTGMIGKTISLDLFAVVPTKRKSTVMTYSECNSLVSLSSLMLWFFVTAFSVFFTSRNRVSNVNQVMFLVFSLQRFIFTNYKFLERVWN